MKFVVIETEPQLVLASNTLAVRLSCAALYTFSRKSTPFGVHVEIGTREWDISIFHNAGKVICLPDGEKRILVRSRRHDPLRVVQAIQAQHPEAFQKLMQQAVEAEQEHQKQQSHKRCPLDPEMEHLFVQAFGHPTSHFEHLTGGFDPVKFSSVMNHTHQNTSLAHFISEHAGPQVAEYVKGRI